MTYTFEFTATSRDGIRRIPQADAMALLGKLAELRDDPYAPNPAVKPLTGKGTGYYRIRSGDYRAVYRVEADRIVILIVDAGNRRDIYRRW